MEALVITYSFLQHYWWLVLSLLLGILVFMMLVQGAQTLLFSVSKTENERNELISIISNKWELTFTTLVMTGGVIFAAFPVFYSQLLSNTYWVWIVVILSFVLQAVSFGFKNKAGDLFGAKTYNIFLFVNGLVSVLLLGLVVAALFTGIEIDKTGDSIKTIGSVVFNIFNWCFALMLVFLTRTISALYFVNQLKSYVLQQRALTAVKVNVSIFVLLFLTSMGLLFSLNGFVFDSLKNQLTLRNNIFLTNLIEMPLIFVILIVGVILFLSGIFVALKKSTKGIWFSGFGAILTVTALVLTTGFNSTIYFSVTNNIKTSLTIVNSSSSYYTLKAMFFVSFLIPFILLYISYVWKAMLRKSDKED